MLPITGDTHSSKYLPSALSSQIFSVRPNKQHEQQMVDKSAIEKFISFLSTQHLNLFKKILIQSRGTHNPIQYKTQFNFQQRWQKMKKSADQVNFSLLMSSSIICYIFSFLIMINNFLLIWFISVFRLFQIQSAPEFFEIGLVFAIADVLLKGFLYIEHIKTNHQNITASKIIFNLQFIKLLIGDVWTIFYCILMISDSQFANVQNYGMLVFDLLTMICLIVRMNEIYNYVAILIIATKYKNQMTIFDLGLKMIVMLHFFAVLLYGVAITSPDSNWMSKIQMEDHFWDTKYIYSLYFACTTMFTVGYGDILPTNKVQIITIMFIEAISMALFGFIVNEVGQALGNMRKQREQFEKDIYNTSKICNYYELNGQLAKKIRDYVINNQKAHQQLGINEEHDFMLKLNEQLRNEVKQIHQLKIIKTSVFFISHWSKKIQSEMAKKLQKCIFAPNQNIHSRGEVDKLYILVKGKIDVFTQKTAGTKVYCRKNLKTIQKLPGQQVFNNVFGYTSFFSGRANRLRAIAKQSTVCYTIGYDEIRDAINEDNNDFEYFHELRQKFQLSTNPEKWQTPNIVSIRQNYDPISFFVIKKHTAFSEPQIRRKQYNRRSSVRCRRLVQFNFSLGKSMDSYNFQTNQGMDQSINSFMTFPNVDGSTMMIDPVRTEEPKSKHQIDFLKLIYGKHNLITRNARRKATQTHVDQKTESARVDESKFLVDTSEFEIGKNYSRFFSRCNKSVVLDKARRRPDVIQKQRCFDITRLQIPYCSSFKRTIRRNFSNLFKDEELQF